jgi:hypothetical protein
MCKQFGQAVTAFAHQVAAPVGNIAQFGSGNGGIIKRQSQWLPMKVTTANGIIGIKNNRVIGNRIEFNFGKFF